MDIPRLLEEIGQMLDLTGNSDKSAWLRQRATELLAAEGAGERRETLLRIKGVLVGMGSLTDIYLEPPSGSGLSEAEANQKFHKLVAELSAQVRTSLQT